jgi:hypothetical protein
VSADASPAPPAVRILGDDPSGLADLLARLLEGNLGSDPSRVRLLHPGVVLVAATDADVAARIELGPGVVTVSDVEPSTALADLRIRASAGDLLTLAGAPLLLGLPSPFRREGRDVLRRILTRRVRISGMVRRPLLLARFARLLSVS